MYPTAQAIAGQRTTLSIGGEWMAPRSGRDTRGRLVHVAGRDPFVMRVK